ncbi:MAG TPA: protein kinase, partial [Oscillatoriaceae cyanobacterium]
MKPFVTSPNLLQGLKLSKAERLFAKRYLLAECLGAGSTGTVYSAFDVQTRKLVAVKHLKRFAHEEELFRFKQSFRAALSLRHPHLVEAYEYVLTGEVPYLTMELVQGERLPTGTPMLEHLAVDVAGQVLLALDYLHARGMLHRDLKPDNLRFTTQGTLKLLDFATLEPIGGPPGGQISGTLAYMAPEVFQGRALAATADLYSVGVLLYELLSGSLPFRAQHTHELIAAHLNAVPRDLGALRPDLSPQLTDLVMRLLAKDPSARPQRASDALRELAPRVSASIAQEAERQGYSYLLATGLVGRQAELNALLAALKQAAGGHGTGVFIGAQPGVGKSRLIQELKLHCQQENVAFLSASCIDEGTGPYGPMRQLLQAVLPFAAEAQPAELERLLAWLGPGRTRAMVKTDLHQAIAAVLAAIARRQPLVLCVDDLQWADTLSLELLTHCLYEHRDAPILWLGAYRPGEIGQHHAVLQAIGENLAEGLVLEALDETECAALVQGVLGQDAPEGLMPLIAETTQGNCFFVIETLRYLVDQGHLRYEIGTWHLSIPDDGVGVPTSIQDLVCQRLHGLSRPALTLAQLAAVYADTLRPASLRRLSGLDEQALLDAINELIERQVWRRSGGGFRFVHERIREALYQELPAEARQALHQQITERLEGLKVTAATLAYHRYRGPDPLSAVPDLCRAGAEAESLGALHEAFRHWKLAADLLETQDEHDPRLLELWLDIGIKCGFSVDSRAGEEALEKALARLEAIGNPFRAAKLIAATTTLIRRLPEWIARPILRVLTRPQSFKPPRKHFPPN